MMYPFLQIDGDTEIVHSDMLPNGEVKESIYRIYRKDGRQRWIPSRRLFSPGVPLGECWWLHSRGDCSVSGSDWIDCPLNFRVCPTGRLWECLRFLRSAHIGCTFGPTRATLWSQFMSMWRRAHHPPCDKSVDYKGGEVSAMQQQLPNPGPFPTEYFADHWSPWQWSRREMESVFGGG